MFKRMFSSADLWIFHKLSQINLAWPATDQIRMSALSIVWLWALYSHVIFTCRTWTMPAMVSQNYIFCVPNIAPIRLIRKQSGLKSIESEIALRKLLFLEWMIIENKLTPTMRNLFHYRVDSIFDESISFSGILPSICEALHRYELFDHFESWFHNSAFLITRLGK